MGEFQLSVTNFVVVIRLNSKQKVKKTELVDVDGPLEHIEINTFYQSLREKLHEKSSQMEPELKSFIGGKYFLIRKGSLNPLMPFPARFPKYELLTDESNKISSQDFMYIFSLLLYHSCVGSSSEFFQKCCERLDEKHQPVVVKFFASVKQAEENKEDISKELLRSAIRESVPQSPLLKFISCSPIKTPVKSDATPSKAFYQEKSKELQRTKTMLDNERYERNLLEADAKNNEEKIKLLRKFLSAYVTQESYNNFFSFSPGAEIFETRNPKVANRTAA